MTPAIGMSQPFEAANNLKGPTMLRVKMQESPDVLTFRLEGRLTGEEAEHVRTLVTRCDPEMQLVFDVTEVMFIDAIGEEVLSLVKRLGAKFIAETSYSLDVCERLCLPLAPNERAFGRQTGMVLMKGTDPVPDNESN